MNEETTTSTQVDASAPVDAGQAEDTTTEQAVQGEETSETTSSDSTTEETPELDEETKAWAEKKGLPLGDPIALAKMIREGDKKVTEATQRASELGKSVQTASSEIGLDEIQQLNNKVSVMEFYQTFPDARSLDEEMAKVLEDEPTFANMPLDKLYFYTKGLQADKGLVAAHQAGSKEALEAAAQAERASIPKASATVRTSPKKITNEDIRNMSTKEYAEAKAAGKIDPFGAPPE